MDVTVLPGSWGTSCTFALLLDPGRTEAPGHCSAFVLSPLEERRRLRRYKKFRGSITQLLYSLSTLHVRDHSLSVQDSLPAVDQLYRAGFFLPARLHLKVSACWLPPLPGFAWRNQSSFSRITGMLYILNSQGFTNTRLATFVHH